MIQSVDVIRIFEETKTSELGDNKIIIKVWSRYISEFNVLILNSYVSYSGLMEFFAKSIQEFIISNSENQTIHQVCLADACRLSLRKIDDLMSAFKIALQEPVQLSQPNGSPYR